MQSPKKRIKGKIKWFNPEKGYGFITSLDGKDYFFPRSALTGRYIAFSAVGENDLVIFSGHAGKKGPRASEVNIVESAPGVNKRTDDRTVCPSCGRRIVPRMIFLHRKPSYSVCPFCGKTVRSFQSPTSAFLPMIVFVILFFAVVGAIQYNDFSNQKKIENKETTREKLISQAVNEAQSLTQKIKTKTGEK